MKRALLLLLVLSVTALWLVPYAFMLTTSWKTMPEISANPSRLLPEAPTWAAYRDVFATIPVGYQFFLSAVVAIAIALLQILLALPAAYALTKLDFAGKKVLFGVVLGCLLVPAQVTFVPVFVAFAQVGLVNTLSALVLPFAGSALGIFLLRQALLQVPDEVVEAARLDGAPEWIIVYRIVAPQVWPTLLSFFLVSVVFHYGDYFWPLVMTTDEEVRTLPLGVALVREQGTGVKWNAVMAANVILSAPILLLFSLLQRHLVRGLGAGS